MIGIVVAIIAALAGPSQESDRLADLPDTHLTREAAVEHLWSARAAALLTGESAEILLSVAWHETRFTPDYVQPEPGNRVSCGVLTPEPIARCPGPTPLVDQYLDGARHLATWRRILGDRALEGYAGGSGTQRAIQFREQMTALARWIAGQG